MISQRLKRSALRHIRPFDDIQLWDRDVTTPRAIRLAEQTGARLHACVEDAIATGRVAEDHIVGEIGEVLAGDSVGRNSADEITLYKSLGVAAQDIVTARHIFHSAEQKCLGTVANL